MDPAFCITFANGNSLKCFDNYLRLYKQVPKCKWCTLGASLHITWMPEVQCSRVCLLIIANIQCVHIQFLKLHMIWFHATAHVLFLIHRSSCIYIHVGARWSGGIPLYHRKPVLNCFAKTTPPQHMNHPKCNLSWKYRLWWNGSTEMLWECPPAFRRVKCDWFCINKHISIELPSHSNINQQYNFFVEYTERTDTHARLMYGWCPSADNCLLIVYQRASADPLTTITLIIAHDVILSWLYSAGMAP